MSTKFTPGPWEADGTLVWAKEQHSAPALWGAKREYSDGRLHADGRRRDCYGPLCDTNDGEYVESRNPEADAHLIAAAPDLYEALLTAIAEVDAVAPELPKFTARLDAAVDQFRAALAKARGEA